jgi:uncharacterized RDD family membrane protein YckC/DNA-binding HxlR family transcriptional regulator
MAVDQENVSKVLSVLSHRIRREILLILNEKGESSFTDLMNTLNIDTGKLSFHIRSLSPFLQQTESGKYRLSRAGEDAVRVIRDVESWAEAADVNRKASQLLLASFKKRTYAFLIDFGIIFLVTALILVELVLELFRGETVISLTLLFASLGFLWVYSTLLEGFSGQSIGKRVIGLKVVKINGKKMDYEHAAVRNFGKILLPFDLLFGYQLKDPRFIRYFDKFAGTTVIDLRQRSSVPATASNSTPEPASTIT